MTIVFSDPTMIQSTSSSILTKKNIDRSLEIVNENIYVESLVVKDHDGSISEVQDDSDIDPNWEMKCLNYEGINKTT